MEYNQSPDQAVECAQLALSLMEDRGIPPQPDNYAVWFAYFTGSDPDLKHTLNVLLDSGQVFTPERNAELYERYFRSNDNTPALHLVAEQAETELGAVLGLLQDVSSGAERYGESLESASGELELGHQAGEIGRIVHRMLGETRAMVERNHALEERVMESSAQIRTLRDELELTRKDSLFDPLTEIANRKHFDTSLLNAAVDADKTGEPVSLLFFDVDHFKSFNDTHGHQVGDQVLKLLSKIMQHNIRDCDTAARYGGEEFAVILPKTGLPGAVRVANRIRTQVANKPLIHRRTGEKLGRVTVSVGASLFRPGETLRDFVERADQALYVAKRTGRNKAVAESDCARSLEIAS